MRRRLDHACWVAFLLLSACSEDPDTDPDQQEESSRGERELDGGRDGGRDAGRMDARADDPRDASRRDASSMKPDASKAGASSGDADVLDTEVDASEPEAEAGAPKTDAGSPREDGGRADAGGAARCNGVTYERFGASFLDSYCAGLCHNALLGVGGVRLDSREGIAAAKDRAKVQVENRTMPPFPPGPTDEERARFVQWVDCGAH